MQMWCVWDQLIVVLFSKLIVIPQLMAVAYCKERTHCKKRNAWNMMKKMATGAEICQVYGLHFRIIPVVIIALWRIIDIYNQ